MDVGVLLALLTNGVVYTTLLLLMSVGLNLAFGLARVINFAHAEFYTLGSFMLLVSLTYGFGYLAGAVLAFAVVLGLGLLIHVVLIGRMRDRAEVDTILLTFGVGVILLGIIEISWGAAARVIAAPDIVSGRTSLALFEYPTYRLMIVLIVGCVIGGLTFLLYGSRLGRALRSAADDPIMAGSLGINVPSLFRWVFAVGAGLGALAGVLGAPIFSAYSTVGQPIMLDAFMVVIIGGLGSLRGMFPAAVIVGLTRGVASGYISEWSLAVVFAIVALILVIRPTGILGEGRQITV